jgi:hypothetical protein
MKSVFMKRPITSSLSGTNILSAPSSLNSLIEALPLIRKAKFHTPTKQRVKLHNWIRDFNLTRGMGVYLRFSALREQRRWDWWVLTQEVLNFRINSASEHILTRTLPYCFKQRL